MRMLIIAANVGAQSCCARWVVQIFGRSKTAPLRLVPGKITCPKISRGIPLEAAMFAA